MSVKQSQRAEVASAIQGIITEASPLNFPPNASADELNFELARTGLRSRRLGMDFEDNYNIAPIVGGDLSSLPTSGTGSYAWIAANGNPNLNFVVIQVGNIIYLYNRNVSSISAGGPLASLAIAQFRPDVNYSFASTEGLLVVVSGDSYVATVSTHNGSSFELDYIRILTRDLWGMEETTNPNFETDNTARGVLTNEHQYNLHNQSWGIPRKDAGGTTRDAIAMFQNDLGASPSNSEQVWAGLQDQAVAITQQPFERMFTNLYNDALGARQSSAKGYFIIDALQRGPSRYTQFYKNKTKYPQLSGDVSTIADTTSGGPSCVAEFAGRIFYSGFQGDVTGGDARSPNFTNYVFFSQLVKSKSELNKCYQEGDPTSRESSDILDTDGGYIRVSGAEKIIAMRAIGINLVIIASNGVWVVTGGTTDSGFSATNFKVSKISNFGGLSPNSVIVENTTAYYWSSDGIYAIGASQLGDLQVSSLTLNRIQTLYVNIPNAAKQSAFGEYDQINKKVRWVYKTGNRSDGSLVTMELIYDSLTQAFTQNKIFNLASYATEIIGIFPTALTISNTTDIQVYAGTDQVFETTVPVAITGTSADSNVQFLRYSTIFVSNGIPYLTFSYYHNTEFSDWFSVDGTGVDAAAYCLTGTATGGDSSVDKQVPYLFMHFIRTEEGVDSNLIPRKQSSCLVRTQWNFANAVESNKWSTLSQAYRNTKVKFALNTSDPYDNGFSIVTTKNKCRGIGKAFALYFETEPGKDCKIVGWNISLNANQIA
jgi:hypothetical protein